MKKEDRDWMRLAPLDPWKLHVMPQVVGGIVEETRTIDYGIAVGFGITDSHNHFLGIISAGIDVFKLIEKINLLLNDDNIKFVILSRDNKVIASSGYQYTPDQSFCIDSKLNQDILSKPLNCNKIDTLLLILCLNIRLLF